MSDMVTRSNLDDRFETIITLLTQGERLEVERWFAHKQAHDVVAESLRDYKRDANEWRSSLIDLRATFLPKNEFLSEHRALEAKLRGEILGLAGKLETLDSRLDAAQGDIKDTRTEQIARRTVFSDTRSVLAGVAALGGLIVTVLLILDRVSK